MFDHLSSRCSARRHCVVPIPAPELFKVHPCRKDLVAYMDATYQCVTGPAARTLFTRHLTVYYAPAVVAGGGIKR